MAISPGVHRFAVFTSVMTFLLLCAGALVTSTGSGLAVPDWPLSYGQFFPPMVGGVLFEHGHRLVAGTVALLTAGQAVMLWVTEPRPWVRRLGVVAVFMVLAQALLGGMTVLFRLPVAVSVAHACLAQLFFSVTVILALVTSRRWLGPMIPAHPSSTSKLPWLCLALSFVIFLQLLMGAIMRHTGSGLAIPDFPTAFGGVFPPQYTFPIAIHFAHRVGALFVVILTVWIATRVLSRFSEQFELVIASGLVVAAAAFQVMLGASVIWLKRPVPLTTAHLAIGAFCFAASVALSFVALRLFGWCSTEGIEKSRISYPLTQLSGGGA